MATNSIRGLVVGRWEEAGPPAWSRVQTIDVAIAVDRELEEGGLNPAARFRELRLADDRFGMRSWIIGCRFPWLAGRSALNESGATKARATSNRTLTADELVHAGALLDRIRSRIDELAGEDPRLTFAYKRKIAKELQYDERGKPTLRIKLKARKRRAQQGMCANACRLMPCRARERCSTASKRRADTPTRTRACSVHSATRSSRRRRATRNAR